MLRFSRNFFTLSRLRALMSLKDVQTNPDNYHATFTKYGWFLVPKTHFANQWTLKQLEEVLLKQQEISSLEGPIGLGDPRYEQLQEKIDEWVSATKVSDVPKVAAKTAKEKREAANRDLYVKQSMGHTTQRNKDSSGQKPTIERVTFTHAWNYYRSVQGIERRERGESLDAKLIAETWRSMGLHEKNQYRQRYAELLELGKDIFRGQIVDKEYKDLMNLKKKLSKKV